MMLAAMKDPPRSSFLDKDGEPIRGMFYPHPSGGFIAEHAPGWMRKTLASCFEQAIHVRKERVLGLCDGLGAHMSPQMVDAAFEEKIDISLRVPHTSHRTQVEDRKLFLRFKAIARSKIDKQIGINFAKGKGAKLSDSDRSTIFRESWEEAFSTSNMRCSWAETGFPEHGVFGYVCDRKVYWDLLAEEERTAKAKAAAGAPANLNYDPLKLGRDDASSSSSDEEGEEGETALVEGAGAPKKGKKRVTSGDFLRLGPITFGEGKKLLDADHAAAKEEAQKKQQRLLEKKEETEARLRERKVAGRAAAEALWNARGKVKKLSKKELYAFLAEIDAWVPMEEGTARRLKPTDGLEK
eukprot:5785303-Prymnesium_polylepis.1